MIGNIRWLGHGSIQIAAQQVIYIDPWRVPQTSFLGDIILVTHDHYDHFSPADIARLRGDQSRVITNEKVAAQLEGAEVLRIWQNISVDRTTIRAVPAYSHDDIHPRSDGGLGFIISVNYYDIYYTGDTVLTPEMTNLRPDILILPIDGEGTMTIESAAEAVTRMRPRWVIPVNWGYAERGTTLREAQEFQKLVGTRAEVVLQIPK